MIFSSTREFAESGFDAPNSFYAIKMDTCVKIGITDNPKTRIKSYLPVARKIGIAEFSDGGNKRAERLFCKHLTAFKSYGRECFELPNAMEQNLFTALTQKVQTLDCFCSAVGIPIEPEPESNKRIFWAVRLLPGVPEILKAEAARRKITTGQFIELVALSCKK